MPHVQSYDLVVLAHQPNTLRHSRVYCQAVRGLHGIAPFLMRDPIPEPFGGHYGVTRSLCTGLRAVGAHFAYAPRLERTSARVAVVLAGIAELRAALEWRRRGGCEFLLAGPNVVELPNEGEGILLSPEIDRVIVASDKVRRQYETIAPQLAGRISVWPAGVDEIYWKPDVVRLRDGVLIYNKRMPDLASELLRSLRERGLRCQVINYGDRRGEKYRLHRFKAELNRASACVLLTLDEPQGIAASEAWSMDVPTLAYRAEGYQAVATVPYLTDATGIYWSSVDELSAILTDLTRHHFKPRQWVLDNMTDTVCARRFLGMIAHLPG